MVKYILRLINWIFVIGLLLVGAFLSRTLFFAGIILIITAIFISPYIQDFLDKFFKVNYLLSVKFIVILMAILMTFFSLQYETEENLSVAKFVLYQLYTGEDTDKLKNILDKEAENKTKQDYISIREDVRAELKYLYDDSQYYEVVQQGARYITFDSYIRKLHRDAEDKLRQEQLKVVLAIVPKLVEEKKYIEAYRLAKPFDVEELQKVMVKAKKQIDENFENLKKWYKSGKYSKVIKTGTKQIDSDCRIKTLIARAEIAKKSKDKNKSIKQTIKKTSRLIDSRKYKSAIALVNNFEFSDNPKLQALVKRAKSKIKKIKEKKIIRKLRNIPSSQIEANLREYANLLDLFPNNKKYQQKLKYYNQKFLKIGKKPPLLISEEEYKKWPFTVPKGELECMPPGKVTFKVNDKIYSISELAIATGDYLKIGSILQDDRIKGLAIITEKGLELCSN